MDLHQLIDKLKEVDFVLKESKVDNNMNYFQFLKRLEHGDITSPLEYQTLRDQIDQEFPLLDQDVKDSIASLPDPS